MPPTKRSSSPSLSTSSHAAPTLGSDRASSPEPTVTSANRPPPRFTKRRPGSSSRGTYTSGRPSPFASPTATPPVNRSYWQNPPYFVSRSSNDDAISGKRLARRRGPTMQPVPVPTGVGGRSRPAEHV